MKTIMNMIRKISLISLIVIVTIILLAIILREKQLKTHSELHIETIKTNSGWGYNVLINNKIYIHQEFIPGVEGNQAFASEKEAEKVANLVMIKMKKGVLPSIKKNELDSLKVGYCNY
jgi:hypothetical protein